MFELDGTKEYSDVMVSAASASSNSSSSSATPEGTKSFLVAWKNLETPGTQDKNVAGPTVAGHLSNSAEVRKKLVQSLACSFTLLLMKLC